MLISTAICYKSSPDQNCLFIIKLMVSNGIKNGIVFCHPDTRKTVKLKADNTEFPL